MPCKPRSWSTLWCWIGFGLLSAQEASAIITRHDVDDTEYLVEDSDYPALADLFEPGDCIGTLIHPSYLLTVAHCAEEMRTSRPLSLNGVSYAIDEILLHPQWRGWNYDIALIRFEEAVQGVTPHQLYRGSEENGERLILVGRGVHATGLEGQPGATMDRQLRRATNIVTDTDAQWIEVYFDEPGEDGVTDLEGVGAAGDSGGPAFIETDEGAFIAGLNSWGDSEGSVRIGQYGAWDYSTRVSQHLEWLDEVTGAENGDDTGDPGDDTGEQEDTGQDDDATPDSGEVTLSSGCGCASTRGSGGLGLILVFVCLGRRRPRYGPDLATSSPR
jgi:hypothetical protein